MGRIQDPVAPVDHPLVDEADIKALKQKVLASHAAGLTEVILPERNRGDMDDVPQEVREAMKFHFAMTVDEVLSHLDAVMHEAGNTGTLPVLPVMTG